MISEMRSKWPTKQILIGYTDLDSAYRQIHATVTTAMPCIVIVDQLDFLCLRILFRTTLTPEEYTTLSEAAIDLGNNILRDESWDKDDLNSLHRSLLPHEY